MKTDTVTKKYLHQQLITFHCPELRATKPHLELLFWNRASHTSCGEGPEVLIFPNLPWTSSFVKNYEHELLTNEHSV